MSQTKNLKRKQPKRRYLRELNSEKKLSTRELESSKGGNMRQGKTGGFSG